MSSLDRPVAPDPYELLPQVGSFTVTSASFQDGATMTDAQAFDSWGMDGDNVSPQLSWSGAPAGTRGYAVTCFDPDAPTPSGFWHWLLVGLPADCTELAEDAGAEHGRTLPEGAFMMANDYGLKAFGGAARRRATVRTVTCSRCTRWTPTTSASTTRRAVRPRASPSARTPWPAR